MPFRLINLLAISISPILLTLPSILGKPEEATSPSPETLYQRCFEVFSQPKYSLSESYLHQLSFDSEVETELEDVHISGNRLTLKAGYSWDGASGLSANAPRTIRASAVHDALYLLMRAGLLDRDRFKSHSDAEFALILEQDGFTRLSREFLTKTVTVFGYSSTKPRNPAIVRLKVRLRRSTQSLGLFLRAKSSGKSPEELVTRPQSINLNT